MTLLSRLTGVPVPLVFWNTHTNKQMFLSYLKFCLILCPFESQSVGSFLRFPGVVIELSSVLGDLLKWVKSDHILLLRLTVSG